MCCNGGMSCALPTLGVTPHLVAVSKPAGLPSVPGRAAGLEDCVWHRVRDQFADALVVHRLDMATSGVMLFARGLPAQRALSRAFESRQVRKRYVAQVHGHPAEDSGTIDLPLAADWPQRPRQRVDLQAGKAAVTHWRVVARDAKQARSTLELEPVTGRSHQLRVHLLALGNPIVGDQLYGVDDAAERLHLHASWIEVPDPAADGPAAARVSFASEVPSWS